MRERYVVTFEEYLDKENLGCALRAIGMIRGVDEIDKLKIAPLTGGAPKTIAQQPQERHCSQDHQALAIEKPNRNCPECGVPVH